MYEFRVSLGFCLFCERLLRSLAGTENDFYDIARIVSEEIEYSEDNTETLRSVFCEVIQ